MSGAIPDQFPELVMREEPTTMQWIACLLGQHEWVARVDMGAKPDPIRVKLNPINYFFEFAAPVCKHCPKQLPPRFH
jgi:hypothetical protein